MMVTIYMMSSMVLALTWLKLYELSSVAPHSLLKLYEFSGVGPLS